MKPLHTKRPTFIETANYGKVKVTGVIKGSGNTGAYLDSSGRRRFWPMEPESVIFNAWLEGVCACKTGVKFPVETPYIRGSVKARAWVRGFRAWERDAKRRK